MARSRTRALLLQLDSIRRFVPFRRWTVLAASLFALWLFACATWYPGAFVIGCVYGLVRAARTAERSDKYHVWLSLTPWTSAKPLPFSAPAFVWQDAVLIALLTGACVLPGGDRHMLVTAYPVGFLTGFLLGRTMSLGVMMGGLYGLIMLFFWLALLTCLPMGQAVLLGILTAMLVLDQVVTPRGLRGLASETLKRFRTGPLPPDVSYVAKELAEISGRKSYPSCPHAAALFFAAVSGWGAFLLARYLTTTKNPTVYTTIGLIAVTAILAIGRLVKYCAGGARLPVPFRARIRTRHLIIPDYDRVLIGPLLVLVVGVIAVGHHVRFGMPPAAQATSVALLVYTACVIGPSLRAFRLTSRFHMKVLRPETNASQDAVTSTQPGISRTPFGGLWLDLARRLAPRASYYTHWTMVWTAAIATVDLAMVAATIFLLQGTLGRDGWLVGTASVILGGSAVILAGMLIAWPAHRLTCFHPLDSPVYMRWLEQLPWKPGTPLPLGPVHWTALDPLPIAGLLIVPVAAALTLMLTVMLQVHSTADGFRPPAAPDVLWVAAGTLVIFGGGLLLAAMKLLYRMGQRGPLVAVALLAGLAVHMAPHPGQICAVLVALLCVAAWGLARGWRDYPWKNTWAAPSETYGRGRLRREPVAPVGRAMQFLSGKCVPLLPRRSTRAMCIVVVTWWSYVAAKLPGYDHDLIIWGLLAVAAIYRLVAYRGASPKPLLNVLGRLIAGRLFLRYDCVYAAPLLALLVCAGLAGSMKQLGAPHYAAAPCTVAVVLSILCFSPPSLRRWRLLGLY